MRAQRWRVWRIEAAFKGVGITYFCIIHITPQRRSISTLRRESRGVSWRDAAAARTQRKQVARRGAATHDLPLLLPDETLGWPLWGPRMARFKHNFPPADFQTLTASRLLRKTRKKKQQKKTCKKKEKGRNAASRVAGMEKTNQPHPHTLAFPRHWFIILISLISTVVPIFQMSFSNLCQTVWPFFLIQLMTSLVARWICNSDWVFYRRSGRHAGVCVFVFISVCSVCRRGTTGSPVHQGKLALPPNTRLRGTEP